MKNFIKKLFPDSNSKFISKNQQILSKINEQESLLTKLSDKDLINLSVDMKNQTNVLDDEVIIKYFSSEDKLIENVNVSSFSSKISLSSSVGIPRKC